MIIRAIGLAGLLSIFAGGVDAQEAERTYWNAMNEGRYLEALVLIEANLQNEMQNIPQEDVERMQRDRMSQIYSMLGRNDLVIRQFDITSEDNFEGYDSEPFEPVDAIAAIREAAADRRVLMINESHRDPRPRAFLSGLLQGLREDGFTHFAAETFNGNDDMERLVSDGYPTQGIGYYTSEPYFGDLVRTAIRLGFQPARYEANEAIEAMASCVDCDFMERIRMREKGQAENLAAILDANPSARMVVFVGYDHLIETGDLDGDGQVNGLMGAEFKVLTGIDPVTVDLVMFLGSESRYFLDEYEYLRSTYSVEHPVALRDSNGSWFSSRPEATDMEIVNPVLSEGANGVPTWMSMNGYRQPFVIEQRRLPQERPILVQAFVEAESELAIPMAQYLLLEDEFQDVTLMMPAGSYRLVAQVSSGPDVDLGMAEIVTSPDP